MSTVDAAWESKGVESHPSKQVNVEAGGEVHGVSHLRAVASRWSVPAEEDGHLAEYASSYP